MTPEQITAWDKVRNHSGRCTCTDCKRWDQIEQSFTEQAEQIIDAQEAYEWWRSSHSGGVQLDWSDLDLEEQQQWQVIANMNGD
jgi:hypothetical protein